MKCNYKKRIYTKEDILKITNDGITITIFLKDNLKAYYYENMINKNLYFTKAYLIGSKNRFIKSRYAIIDFNENMEIEQINIFPC